MTFLRWQPGLGVGDAAPDFDCPDEDGKQHRLADYRGRWLVLFFYPKDDTPICLKEACAFNDDWDEFRRLGAEVLGCSTQGAESHKRFREACRLRYRLLTDEHGRVRNAFKVPHLLGLFTARCTFLIDPQGSIRFTLQDQEDGLAHPARALEALRAAQAPAGA